MTKKRNSQILDSLTDEVVDLRAANNRIDTVYLFSIAENRIVAAFELNKPNEAMDIFIDHMERFTKSSKDSIILTSRNNVKINDNNFFACVGGVWKGMDSHAYSNVLGDMQHLFTIHQSAILNTAYVRNLFANEAMTYGLVDVTIILAYNAGTAVGQQQAAQNMQRQFQRSGNPNQFPQNPGLFGGYPYGPFLR